MTMHYLRIDPSGERPELAHLAPFKAVLCLESAVSGPQRDAISTWLVAMGCCYVIACGADCEPWQDAIREANLRAVHVDHMTARDFVMATTHPHESLRAVFWFAKKAARHPEADPAEIVVVHVASTDRGVEYQAMFQRA